MYFWLSGLILILLSCKCASKPSTSPGIFHEPNLKRLVIKSVPGAGFGADITLSIQKTKETDTTTEYKLVS